MARAGLTTAAVVEAAAALADADGLEAVTLARLADRLGVRSPSLYAHVESPGDLRVRLAERGARELADAIAGAVVGRSRADALRALAGAYRRYAAEHPGCYAAAQRARELLTGDAAASGARVTEIALAVLRGYGLEGTAAVHAARTLRAALHGFAALELEGGFALDVDLDASFTWLVELLDRGLGGPSPIPGPPAKRHRG